MNRQNFDISKESGRKQFDAFLKVLLDYNACPDNDDYNDLHIYQDEMFMTIEWDKVPYSHEWGGRFQYVDYDDVVMKEVRFPDDHYEYVLPESVDDVLKDWHRAHPEWVQTSYGTWTNMEENRRAWIEYNSKEWMERVADENDSTFTESFIEVDTGSESFTLDSMICAVDNSVLRRSEIAVLSSKLYTKIFGDSDDYGASIKKLKELKVMTKAFPQQQDLDETSIHVYVSDTLKDDCIYYVTDTVYLIHRAHVEVK